MATNLGELFYTLRVQDLTKQDIDAINQRLQNLGSNIQINATDLKTAFQNASNNIDLKIGTVSNLKQAVDSAIGTNGLDLKIDQNAFKTAFNAALTQAQGQGLNLSVNTHNLRQLIAQQLQAPFEIQIKVMKDQARQAVHNALNNASNISNADALKYQRLKTGEMKAEQAELIRLKQTQLQARDAAKAHATASVNLGGALGSNIRIAGELGAAMTSLYSIHAAKEFLAQVVEIGGELEHQKIALDTIYGDPGKTSTLFSQIKGLARQSPFGVMDLTKNIKQLSAYGVAYNEVYDTAKRLADISAATSVDINRLILAFGKTKNRTFLDGLEAKQFAYANIPIYDALSKKLTELEGKFVSVKDVMKRISKREIGFDMVKDILWDMTDEGGKFYNMQEKLAGSVKTSWKLVRDNIELMFGEIAESAIGGGLKGMAEILQGLTRKWKTLATVVGSAAAIFGIYKLAVMASNNMMGLHHAASLKEVTTTNELAVAKLNESAIYRKLNAAESEQLLLKSALDKLNRSLLLSHKELTAAEWEAAFVQGKVTEDYILRRIALGKLTQAEIQYLVTEKIITQQQVQTAVAANKAGISLAMLAAVVKAKCISAWQSFVVWGNKVVTGLSSIGTKIKTLNWQSFVNGIKNIHKIELPITRIRLALNGVWKVMKSIGAFVFNPATLSMAAIGGLMYLYERNREELEKAKEIADNLFTKAVEGAKNLEITIKDLKPGVELSDLELTQQIEKLENAIKDYSPDPVQAINETLVTQEGHVNTLVERYEALKQKVEDLKNSFDDIKTQNLNISIENAINATNEGWMFDDIRTNLKDYSNALKDRRNAITDFAVTNKKAMVNIIDKLAELKDSSHETLKSIGEDFLKATSGMTSYEQKLNYIVENFEKYRDVLFGSQLFNIGDYHTGKVNAAYDVLLSDTEKLVAKFRAEMALIGFDLNSERGKEAARTLLKGYLDGMEEGSEEAKVAWARVLESNLNIKLLEDKTTPLMIAKFRNIGEKCGDELVSNLMLKYTGKKTEFIKGGKDMGEMTLKGLLDYIQYNGPESLTQAGWDMLTAMMREAGQGAMEELELSHAEWNNFLKANPLKMVLSLFIAKDSSATDQQKMLWNHGDNLQHTDLTDIFEGWSKNETSVKDVQDNALKEGKEIKARLEAAKKNAHVTKEELSKIEKEWADAEETYRRAGWVSLEEDLKKGKKAGKGSQKDTVAENLKQQFKDLKDAWNEYKKWEKSVGDTAAAETVANSELFGDMPLDKIPRTVEQYQKAIEEIKAELQKAGVKDHPQRESLLNEILKTLLAVKKTVVDEQIEKALAIVDEEIEKKLEDWNLYEKIRKATGNKDLAYQFTFGLEPGGQTDYIRLVKDNFNSQIDAVRDVLDEKLEGELKGHAFELDFEMINRDNVTSLPKELQKAWEEAVKRIEKYRLEQRNFVADLLSEYQNTLQRIEKIEADAEEKIMKVWNDPFLNDAQKTNLEMKIEVKADYEKFQLSNDYLQFFGGVLAMTREEAENVGAAIRQHLDEQLQKGVISAKEYYDEIEKIEQQLAKIRNVRSKGLTFMTEGINGLNYKKAEENDAIRLSLAQRIKEYEEKAAKAREDRDEKSAKIYESQAQNLREQLKIYDKIAQIIVQNQELWDNIAAYASVVSNIINGIGDAFDTLREMAGALGFDSESDDWLNVGGLIDTLSAVSDGVSKVVQSLMNGDIGGMISGAATALLTPITIWAQIHDKKLQKDIEASERLFNKYQDLIDGIEDRLNHVLGNRRNLEIDITGDRIMLEHYTKRAERLENSSSPFISQMANSANAVVQKYQARVDAYEKGGALGYERQLMTEQLAQLQRQKADYEGMKGDHSADIDALNRQIEEQRQAILVFSKEMAEVTYGINLNDWAGQIGDALVDAFSKGEDAAEAFKDTVNNIMRSLVSQMITQDIIAPAFKEIEKYLFGEDGLGGVYGEDFILDEAEAGMLANMLGDLEGKIDDAKKLYDVVNDMMGGGLDNKDKSEDSLRVGIQSITENTADLLASYVNSIRAYVAQDALKLDLLVNEYVPNLYLVAEGQLQQLVMIAENTRRNMLAAEAMKSTLANVEGILTKVTKGTSKFYVN